MENSETVVQAAPSMPEPDKSLLDRALMSAERLEKANAELKALLDRQEKLAALDMLGGRSEAGRAPEQPKEETPKEYKDRLMRGQFDRRV